MARVRSDELAWSGPLSPGAGVDDFQRSGRTSLWSTTVDVRMADEEEEEEADEDGDDDDEDEEFDDEEFDDDFDEEDFDDEDFDDDDDDLDDDDEDEEEEAGEEDGRLLSRRPRFLSCWQSAGNGSVTELFDSRSPKHGMPSGPLAGDSEARLDPRHGPRKFRVAD